MAGDRVPLAVVTSSYAPVETFQTLAKPKVPAQARIAFVHALSAGLQGSGWHVRLEEPSREEVLRCREWCRDDGDWPILADAVAEHCDIILTYDGDLLESSGRIRCMRPEDLAAELVTHPVIAEALHRAEALLSAGCTVSPEE